MSRLNQDWEFQKLPGTDIDKIEEGVQLSGEKIVFERVDLPHTWYQDGAHYKGTVVYRKKLFLDCQKENRVFLNFQAADRWCKLFVNQSYVGEHKGGYSSFTFEISKYCSFGRDNIIEVFLDNRSFGEISPLTGDFTVFGGLYRDVNLIITENNCFDRTYYGTNGVILNTFLEPDGTGQILLEPHVLITDESKNIELLYQVFAPQQQLCLSYTEKNCKMTRLTVSDPILWDGRNHPALYHFHSELKVDGKTVDYVDIPFGFRQISLDSEKGFFLNKKHVKIRGIAKHQDCACAFQALTQEHWNRDINDIMEIGANSVRLSHYQHPQEMYDLCDEKGLVVWAEIPMLKMTENVALFENACSQLKELILQNLHHPSICFWGIQNEIAMFGETNMMYQRLEQLNSLAKTLDSTRIISSANLFCVNNNSPLNRITDAVGYNIYFGWYYGEMRDNEDFVERFHMENPDVPLGITEYGVDCNLEFHSEVPRVKDYSEEFQALYHETVYPMFCSKDYIWGTYVWNLFDFSSEIRDEGGMKYRNGKGLISYDRTIKKDAYYYYKAQWSLEPFVKIAQSRFVNRAESEITVIVYSNQSKVELFVNGRSYHCCSSNGVFRFETVQLKKGSNKVMARGGDYIEEVIFCRVEEKDLSYIYVDSNPGVNVKNWFLDEVEEQKLFPKGKLSVRESCKAIMENEEAVLMMEQFMPELVVKIRERQSFMPLERVLNYMKDEISDEKCRELNAKLTQITMKGI